MSRSLLGVLARAVARVSASRFAKPAARVALVAMGLACLAAIGRAAVAGSVTTPAIVLAAAPSASGGLLAPPVDPSPTAPSPPALPVANPSSPAATPATPATSRGPASSDDPVILNSAGLDDLRRLPGIGEKRATAILALRARLGRLRAIEDLMKVKGIGRATLKRLRPLVRLDALGDAGM
jgi:competence protein ComEA